MNEYSGSGGDRPCPLRHLWHGMIAVTPSRLSDITCRNTSGSALPSTANWPTIGYLREQLLQSNDHHLARETDTEIIMHELSRELSGDARPEHGRRDAECAKRFDGAYSMVLLNACGDMLVARDPLGIKPMCYAIDGPLFAAASESVALANLGFRREQIQVAGTRARQS